MSDTLLLKQKKLKRLKIIKWCILILGTIFIGYLEYKEKNHWDGSYCSRALQCTSCKDGEQECHYNIENDDGTFSVSEDTILCDCIEK